MTVVERPATEVELAAIVRQAAGAGRPVRVGRPSRSRHYRGEEVLIDLGHYQRLLRVDREGGQATVQAGVTLGTLGRALGSWGLSMENGTRDPAQSLGGAVSLGAHGTGAAYGGVATQVTGMRLVAPDGNVISCSTVEEPEIFNAARVGLGALGVISTVTVRCQPGFNLRGQVTSVELSEALDRFDAYAASNDYFELSWLPGRDRARVITANRTEDQADGGAVDRSYRWWGRRRTWPPVISYSFPRQGSAADLQRARDLSAGRGRGLLFPIEVSVTAGDDFPLSPDEGRASVHIAGVAGLAGRPQWGAPHGMSAAALAGRYPRWDEWQAVRDRLDPDRRLVQRSGQG